jgi:hypothetical protein
VASLQTTRALDELRLMTQGGGLDCREPESQSAPVLNAERL